MFDCTCDGTARIITQL